MKRFSTRLYFDSPPPGVPPDVPPGQTQGGGREPEKPTKPVKPKDEEDTEGDE